MRRQGRFRALRLGCVGALVVVAFLEGAAVASAALVQQGGKLTAKGETGKALFGLGAALSADGNTALIPAPYNNGATGAAWAFTRSGGIWSEQQKFTGSGAFTFGCSAALSADGNTALIGICQGKGAWVFTRAGGTWTEQQKLPVGAVQFGSSVALSADGNTALIGAVCENECVGAAWVCTRSGSTWTEQQKLTAGGEIGEAKFGWNGAALSADGNTALMGGSWDNGEIGAEWAFTRSGGTWTEQQKITGGEEIGKGSFGLGAALSSDGNAALIGGRDDNEHIGAAWRFTRSGGTWTEQQKLTGGEEIGKGLFGLGIGLSADGQTALVGGMWDNNEIGAAWAFGNGNSPPTITKVKPAKGPVAGGTTVTITGTNFSEVTAVKFGAINAAGFFVNSETTITAFSPPESAGTVDVTVARAGVGPSAIAKADRFKFTPTVTGVSPNSGSKTGGTVVTVTGTGFAPGTATIFKFGTAKASSVNCTSSTTCAATAPAHAAGKVDVKATVNKVASPKNVPADQFTYS